MARLIRRRRHPPRDAEHDDLVMDEIFGISTRPLTTALTKIIAGEELEDQEIAVLMLVSLNDASRTQSLPSNR